MIDYIVIKVLAGNGGNGTVTFRREKYVPYGGPDGGDGGKGGDVSLVAVGDVATLQDFRSSKRYVGGHGENGRHRNQTGHDGKPLLLQVPLGTIVRWSGTTSNGSLDLDEVGSTVVVARGGEGGRGNARFTSSINRAPRLAERGEKGEAVEVTLELKLLADVGLVGLPNAGKSSVLAIASGAHPKVDAYPFTTTEPNLGVVDIRWTSLVLADIPGLIEGAHEGRGLGDQFLRHIERTAVLVHMVDGSLDDPVDAWQSINRELTLHEGGLAEKPQILAVNKVDIPEVRARQEEIAAAFAEQGVEDIHFISAASGEGVQDLMKAADSHVEEARKARIAAVSTRVPHKVVLRPEPARVRPHVEAVEQGVWRLKHPRAERMVSAADLSDMTVAGQIWHELGNLGVIQALERAGAEPGDWVLVGDMELIWR